MSQPSWNEELNLPPHAGGALWLYRGPHSIRRRHCHAELELNLVLHGQATYLVGEERVSLARRTLLWLFPAQDHVLLEQSDDFEMWIAVWRPQLLVSCCLTPRTRPLLDEAPDETWCRRISEVAALELADLLACLAAHSTPDEGRNDLFEAGLAFALLRALAAHEAGGETPKKRVHPCVEKAARLLRDRVPPPALPDLAREVGLSPSRLSRLFAQQVGVSISDFRAAQCLERARHLCRESDGSLFEIAERAGFGSYAQFHRLVAREFDCKPMELKTRGESRFNCR